MNEIKIKITALVTKWEIDNPTEFGLFLESRKKKTDNLSNKFGEMKGSTFIERILFEMPESLDIELINALSVDDMKWFRSKEGSLWFNKSFKQYNVSQRT